jgi:hypothetical protein
MAKELAHSQVGDDLPLFTNCREGVSSRKLSFRCWEVLLLLVFIELILSDQIESRR